MGKFLGDCVVYNQKVRFLLCTKVLFHRYFSQVSSVQIDAVDIIVALLAGTTLHENIKLVILMRISSYMSS